MTPSPQFDTAAFYMGDPHATYRALRTDDPVHWYEDGDFWVVTSYEAIRSMSSNPAVFSSTEAPVIAGLILRKKGEQMGVGGGAGVMFLDPPEHTAHRKAIGARFTPKAVSLMEDDVRRAVCEVLDAVPQGSFDWIEHVAEVVPVQIFARLMGLPRDEWDRVASWSTAIAAAGAGDVTPDVIDFILNEIGPYLLEFIMERKGRPGDDLLSALAAAEVDGQPFDETTAMIYAITLLAAGSETTQSLIAGMAACLADHPDQAELVFADESLAGATVEETLRWWTPVMSMARTTKEDVELAGTTVEAGQGLLMLYSAANRDAAKFGPTAEEFDVRRPDASQHLGFGFGEHFCMGAHLARREGRMLLEEMVRRYEGIRIVGDRAPRPSTLVHTFDSLPVELIAR